MKTSDIKYLKDNDIVLDQFHEDLKNTVDENNSKRLANHT